MSGDFEIEDNSSSNDIQLHHLPKPVQPLRQDSEDEFNKSYQVAEENTYYDKYNDNVGTVEFEGHLVYLETLDVKNSWKLRFQVLCAYLSFLTIGLLDQAFGAILQYLLEDYHIDRSQLSILFATQFVGYLITSLANGHLHSKFGLYRIYCTCLVGSMCNTLVYSSKPPFFCLVLISLVSGTAFGGMDCALNLFIGNLRHSNQLLGSIHACYGFGCFISPLLSTYLIHKGMAWNHYYLVIFVVVFTNFIMALIFYKNETSYKYNYKMYQAQLENGGEEAYSTFSCIKNKLVMFFSFVLFVYIGGELSLGTWMYNYFITIKKISDFNASYITSSYWLFMTFGRLFMGFVTGYFFEDVEYKGITLYCGVVCIGSLGFAIFSTSALFLQIVSLWLIGIFIGPVFSTTVVIAIKTLPATMGTTGVGIISGLGSAGAAVIPAVIGWLSENLGSGNGQGLVYFPFITFFTFLFSFFLWFAFYIYNGKRLSKLSENYTDLPQGLE